MFDFEESTIVGRKLRGPDGHWRRVADGRPPYFSLNVFSPINIPIVEGAREALTDMPPRMESELDSVTLHNMALLNVDSNASESFNKLQFLLQQQFLQQQDNPEAKPTLACPPETFANLLLLYCKYEYFDMAADLLAEHADLTYKNLSPLTILNYFLKVRY